AHVNFNRSPCVAPQFDVLLEEARRIVIFHRIFGRAEVDAHDVIGGAGPHLHNHFRADGKDVAVLGRNDFNGGGGNGEREEGETGGKAKRGGSLNAQRLPRTTKSVKSPIALG